jgi:hypothetical protein
MKRYSILNRGVRGSYMFGQLSHGLNRLWRDANDRCWGDGALALFYDWATHSEVEVNLHGGTHQELEALFSLIRQQTGVPVVKFNEPDLNDACTVISFVAPERWVKLNDYIRNRRLPAHRWELVKSHLMTSSNKDLGPITEPVSMLDAYPYSDEEIQIACQIACMPLAG